MLGSVLALVAVAATATAASCSREALQKVTDAYVAAQTAGKPATLLGSGLAASSAFNYTENEAAANVSAGF